MFVSEMQVIVLLCTLFVEPEIIYELVYDLEVFGLI